MDLNNKNPQFILAEKICSALQAKGYQALLAGGCVRDFLLHRVPNDYDVATSASPEAVEQIFAKTIPVGKNFGVIIVVEGDEQVEVATFRKDGPYVDGRRPSSIEFAEAKEDAQRRDFTVNGLFYDLASQQILDYVEGQIDLEKKQIRAIGEPAKRFKEDHLRLLRAPRFAAQLGFEIESMTWKSLQAHQALISSVSGERIQDEMTKFLMGSFLDVGLRLLFESGLLATLIGEKTLQWQPTHAFFVRKENSVEDRWFRFFFWLENLIPNGASLPFYEGLCEKWKFSRDLKQKCLKSMQWIFESKPFLNRRLGDLLALSYDPEHLRGLIEYSEFYLSEDERQNFEKFLQRRLLLGREKPKPWLTAADLKPAGLQGEELGQALKSSFWEQLEGKIQSKAELLKMWGI